MLSGGVAKLRACGAIVAFLSIPVWAQLPQNDNWRLSVGIRFMEADKPEAMVRLAKKFEYYTESPRYIFHKSPIDYEQAFQELLADPSKELVSADYDQGRWVVFNLKDISREEEQKAMEIEARKIIMMRVDGYQGRTALGRALRSQGFWDREAGCTYFHPEYDRAYVTISFTNQKNWDWETNLHYIIRGGMGPLGCVFEDRFGNKVIEYDPEQRKHRRLTHKVIWIAGQDRSIRVKIEGIGHYPEELVKAYLEKYPSVLTGNEKIDRYSYALSLIRCVERDLQKYMETKEQVLSRSQDLVEGTLSYATKIVNAINIKRYYVHNRDKLREKYVEDGKYEFEKYWEELKALRQHSARRISELREMLEKGRVEHRPGSSTLLAFDTKEEKKEPTPAVSPKEEPSVGRTASGQTVVFVVVGLGLAGVLAVAVYLLRRRRKSIE